jgi:DNA modification methylase
MEYNNDLFTLFCGDATPLLQMIAQKYRVDCVITDPPYGINGASGTINKKRGKGNYEPGYFEDTLEYIKSTIIPIVSQCIDLFPAVIVTPGNRCFCSYPQPESFGAFYQPAASGLQAFGNVDAQPIFYYGKNPTGVNCGKRMTFKMGITDENKNNLHPCPKQPRAWLELILEHTLPGQTILDPFMGSGTTGLCTRYGRKFIGVDLIPRYFEYTKNRLLNLQNDLTIMEYETAAGAQMLPF